MKLKTNLTRKISKLFFLKWSQKYYNQKGLFKFINWSILIVVLCFWFIFIFIIPFLYLGIIVSRKHYYNNFKFYLLQKLNSKERKVRNKIIVYSYMSIFCLIIFILIIMLFPIPFLVLIFIGILIEKKKLKPYKKQKNTYILQQITDKQEIKNMKTTEKLD